MIVLLSIPRRKDAFTLVELMLSMSILTILLLLLVSITSSTQRTWTYTCGKIEEFRNAREGFEAITRKLSQATLNTYWDYLYPNGTLLPPSAYVRQSELRFISGQTSALIPTMQDANGNSISTVTHAVFFQAPLGSTASMSYSGLEKLLNTCGYFIEFGSDKTSWPPFLQNAASPPAPQQHYRFRLMELMEPSESLTLYTYTSGTNSAGVAKNPTYITNPALPHLSQPMVTPAPTGTGLEWFTTPLTSGSARVRVLAENIVALVILPKLPPSEDPTGTLLAPYYNYDSTAINFNALINPKNQLPPVIQVTMVAVDEASFNRYQTGATRPSPDPLYANSPFTDATQYPADLQALQKALRDHKINYRVFTTNIILKAARWSRSQIN